MLCLPDVRVANGCTGRGAVLLPPGQSTKHPSLLSCRYFLTPLNTRDSINCFKRSLSSLSLLHSRSRRQTQLKTFSSGPVNEALRLRQTLSMTTKSKWNFSRERRKITVAPQRHGISGPFNRHLGMNRFSDSSFLHVTDTRLDIQALHQTTLRPQKTL